MFIPKYNVKNLNKILTAMKESNKLMFLREIERETDINVSTISRYFNGIFKPILDIETIGGNERPFLKVFMLKKCFKDVDNSEILKRCLSVRDALG